MMARLIARIETKVEDEGEIGYMLDELYITVCSKCKYYNQCQKELYDCPAIIRLAKIKIIMDEGKPEE